MGWVCGSRWPGGRETLVSVEILRVGGEVIGYVVLVTETRTVVKEVPPRLSHRSMVSFEFL